MSQVSPEPLFQVAQGFMAAKYLFAANNIGVFRQLSREGQSLERLTDSLAVPPRTLRIVLDALVGLGLLERSQELYRNSAATEAFLSGRGEHNLGPFLRFWDRLSYRGWERFEDTVRAGRVGLAGIMPSEEDLHILLEGIAAVTLPGAIELANRYDFSVHRCLLDVGCGTGSFSIEILRRHPTVHALLYDITTDVASANVSAAGLEGRTELITGDFFVDPMPTQHDVILVSSVAHALLPEQNRTLLARLREASQPGTTLLFLDFWLDASRSAPLFNALMAGEFLVVDGGDSYTAESAREWLATSGWQYKEHVPMAGAASMLVAVA